MSPDEQSLVQRRPFGGYGVWTGLRQACSGSKSEDIGGVSLPVVHPVLGFKPKITLIGSLDSRGSRATQRGRAGHVARVAVQCGPGTPRRTRGTC